MAYTLNMTSNDDSIASITLINNEGFYAFYQKMNFVYGSMKIIMKENKAFKRYLMKWTVSTHLTHSERQMLTERLHTLKGMVNATIFNVLANTHDVDFKHCKGLRSLLRKIRMDATKNVNLCKLISAKPTI
jgi:hypothetical protein